MGTEVLDFRGIYSIWVWAADFPGLALAVRMLNLLLASLIHRFDWKPFPDRMAPEGINTKDKFGLTLQKAIPLVAIPVVVATVE